MEDKRCELYDERYCNGCGECEICDLNPNKACDNCKKCIQTGADYLAIEIDEVIMDEEDASGAEDGGEA